MAAYLQRLLDTAAANPAGPAGLAPVVRSSSPVFEQNQLLALEQPVAASAEPRPVEVPADAWSEPWRGPAAVEPGLPGEPRGPALVAVPPVPRAPPPPLADPASAPEARAPTAAPAFATPFERARRPPPARHPRAAPVESSPSSPGLTAVVRAVPPAGPLAPEAAVPEPVAAGRREEASPPRPEAAAVQPIDAGRRGEAPPREPTEGQDAGPHLRPATTDDLATLDPRATLDRESEQSRIDLSPRRAMEPVPADPPREAQASPAQPVQPTITIGQVTVEVVEDSRPSSPPLTAASASMIGPLGQARAARRLIALRRL